VTARRGKPVDTFKNWLMTCSRRLHLYPTVQFACMSGTE